MFTYLHIYSQTQVFKDIYIYSARYICSEKENTIQTIPIVSTTHEISNSFAPTKTIKNKLVHTHIYKHMNIKRY